MTSPLDPSDEAPSQSSATSMTLLERARNQDAQAWEHLVALYAPLVYRVCRVAQLTPHDAADVVQEVLSAVNRNLSTFHRDRAGDSFRGWLLTVAKNKIRDHFRRRVKWPPAVGGTAMHQQLQQVPELTWESSSDGSHFDSDANLMGRAMQVVQGDFADKTWQAFWSTTVEGEDPAQVAERLGLSKWSVYQAKRRVLQRLREELKGMTD